jgi:eukaryotic-like serine/threonine-protein kinase
MTPSTAMPAPMPTRVGRYELRQALGTGGMASVHLAVARSGGGFHKAFALKRMHPHLAQIDAYAAMFIDEARIASRIDHPNVCAVVDFGAEEGEYFLAMELLVGEPFGKLIARMQRLPDAQRQAARAMLVSLVADACEGVHAAHELETPDGQPMQVVHRDISPHNLLVTYDGVMKVLDFGVARAVGQRHQTVTGEVKGKFSYMAPEQMRGEVVDRRADVWSLGVVLWEALAARPLFRRASQSETVLAVLAAEVPSLVELVPGLDASLDGIVRRALSIDPSTRYPTARAMARELRTWVAAQGAPPDAGHVAHWMVGLFPEERTAKRQLLRDVMEAPGGGELTPSVEVRHGDAPSVPSESKVVQRREGSGSSEAPTRRWLGRRGHLVWPTVACAAGAALLWTWAAGGEVVLSDGAAQVVPESAGAVESAPGGEVGGSAETPPGGEPVGPLGAAPPSDEHGAGEGVAEGSPAGDDAPEESGAATASVDPEAQAAPRTAKSARTPRRAARATPAARPRGTGKVNVAVRGGWAHVYLGRRRLGPTPGTYALPAGRHVLRLRGEDGEELARVPVQVEADGVAQVAVDLK